MMGTPVVLLVKDPFGRGSAEDAIEAVVIGKGSSVGSV